VNARVPTVLTMLTDVLSGPPDDARFCGNHPDDVDTGTPASVLTQRFLNGRGPKADGILPATVVGVERGDDGEIEAVTVRLERDGVEVRAECATLRPRIFTSLAWRSVVIVGISPTPTDDEDGRPAPPLTLADYNRIITEGVRRYTAETINQPSPLLR
jgi:hypothetical protein